MCCTTPWLVAKLDGVLAHQFEALVLEHDYLLANPVDVCSLGHVANQIQLLEAGWRVPPSPGCGGSCICSAMINPPRLWPPCLSASASGGRGRGLKEIGDVSH